MLKQVSVDPFYRLCDTNTCLMVEGPVFELAINHSLLSSQTF